jgi:hypothetical protein
MFNVFDKLRPTATGLDNLPSWFLQVGAPLFAVPVANLMNLSLDKLVVPMQWKRASILPILKVNTPSSLSDFRPISITPVLSRVLERIVTREHIYPALKHAPPSLDFSDQFAFQPTTAALISILHTITSMLETNQYVIVYAIDFSKAFDSVRHSTLKKKFALLCLSDNIYITGSDLSSVSIPRHILPRSYFKYQKHPGKHNSRVSNRPSFLRCNSIRPPRQRTK